MINFDFGVIAAAIASMVLGMLWYGPVFGKLWMRLSGIKMTDKQMQEAKKKGMGLHYLAAFLGNIVMAFAINMLLNALGVTSIGGAWAFGVVVWIGFILTTTLVTIDAGRDPLKEKYELAKNLKIGMIMYFLVALAAVIILAALAEVALANLVG